jgi:ribosomal protein S18 acetylase RimI-like enzyme
MYCRAGRPGLHDVNAELHRSTRLGRRVFTSGHGRLEELQRRPIGADKPRKLSIVARNEDEQIVGGLLAETKWNWMFIGWVWIDEKYRARGIGNQLMRDAEREAKVLGCDHTHLTTLDFQAKGFYEKLGYEVFAALEDYPPGHTRFMMKKKISDAPW